MEQQLINLLSEGDKRTVTNVDRALAIVDEYPRCRCRLYTTLRAVLWSVKLSFRTC
ncbi:MAG: hypothetical protein WBO49_00405 [Candidatus Saccharimonas sp.]